MPTISSTPQHTNHPPNPPNAAILLQGLKDLGLHHVSPADGAFYIYADVGDELDDAVEFAKGRLLTR